MAYTPSYSYVNGTEKSNTKSWYGSAVVSSGNVVFWMTDTNTSGGNPIFNNVYMESVNFTVSDPNNQYEFSNFSLSGDKKSLTVTVNRLGTVLIGIIQFVTAANGTTVYLQIKGD